MGEPNGIADRTIADAVALVTASRNEGEAATLLTEWHPKRVGRAAFLLAMWVDELVDPESLERFALKAAREAAGG